MADHLLTKVSFLGCCQNTILLSILSFVTRQCFSTRVVSLAFHKLSKHIFRDFLPLGYSTLIQNTVYIYNLPGSLYVYNGTKMIQLITVKSFEPFLLFYLPASKF